MRILVVEDELKMASLIRRGLVEEGHAADVTPKGEDAIWMAEAHPYDVVVLDVMLPGVGGFETCRRLRNAGVWTPVLMLTARDAVDDRVAGLDAGADDYLVKPFATDELLARVRALLRRGVEPPSVLAFDDVVMDLESRAARRGKAELALSAREADLLELLLRNPRRVISRTQALDELWGSPTAASLNVVDRYVSYLRRKLGEPQLIHTVRGVGFVLDR